MENNIIKFHSSHSGNKNEFNFRPAPVKDHIPKWFMDKDKYKKDANGQYMVVFFELDGKAISHRMPSWKSCPALLDVFTSGYYLFTPCDIVIKEHDHSCDFHGNVELDYDSDKWGKNDVSAPFIGFRGKEEGLPVPAGFNEHTFAWRPNWYCEVPEGYTTLVVHPINRDDLPFRTVSGFIDATNVLTGAGQISFYIRKDWYGTIPAGTPYAQVIPIKNESWATEIVDHTDEELKMQNDKKNKEYMIGHGMTKYKEQDWLKKHYE
jgi:hypothetical protein